MSVRRMMLFTLGAKIKNLIEAFKTRVFAAQGEFEAETCLEAQLTDLDNKGLLDSSSFVVTPNGYEENLLFSVIPNTSASDLMVTRATTGTRVNADGLIEQVPYNLLSQSQNFENVFWIKQRTTIGQNVILAPDGTLTADNVIANNGVTYEYTGVNGVNVISSSFSLNTEQRTVSFYLKYNGLNRIRVIYGSTSSLSVPVFVEVDLQLGIITNSNGGVVASNFFIEDAGNGWYRVGFNFVTTLSPTNNRFAVALGDTTKTTGNGIDGVYVWGAQLVTGTQPRDYFPTTNRFNVPRIDYSSGSCPSILVEPQRTNLVLRSEEFDNTSIWQSQVLGTGVNPIRIANAAISPDGAQNADRITFNRGAGNTITDQSVINQQITISTTGTYIFSVWLKASASEDVGKQVFIRCGSASPLLAVTLTASWVRFQTSASVTAGSNSFQIGSRGTVTLNNIVTADIWGAQLELGANATSYIPTTTAAVTRNADIIDNTNMSSLIGQTEGAMYIDFNHQRLNPLADSIIATISNGVISNSLVFAVLMNGDFAAILRTSGTTVIFISIPAASFTLGRKKIVISYKSGNTNLYVNGVKIGSTNTTAFTFPVTINKFNLGSSATGTALPNTTINSAALYKTTLTDAQAIQLTTL